jgi:NAD(P)-dependent dehydrogenase (short-subunit alcohol dehydrogenase family)
VRFRDKTAVLAGAASPIGLACARRLLAEGCTVIVVDRPQSILDELDAEVSGADSADKLRVLHGDPTDPDTMTDVAAGYSSVDLLLNLHYSYSSTSLLEASMTDWIDALRTNLLGPVACSKALLPALRQSPAAAIVHLGSIDGALGNPGVPLYSTSKAGLVALTHVMAHEFGSYGIRVNCVARAAVADEQTLVIAKNSVQRAIDATPLRRFARADEVAAGILYLASGDASFITGTVLTIDGGRSGLTPGTVF